MATIPQSVDPLINPKTGLAQRTELQVGAFTAKAAMLAKLPLTQENAEQALIWDTHAKQFLDGVEKEVAPVRKKLFEAHRDFVALIKRQTDPVLRFRQLCSTFRANYERARQAKVEADRRAKEAADIAEKKRLRDLEKEHLLQVAADTGDEGAFEQAIAVEQAPIVASPVSIDKDEGKNKGDSVTFKKVGKIVDIRKFLKALAEYQSMTDLVEVKNNPEDDGPALKITQSALDDKLKRNAIDPVTFGLDVIEKPITRNTSRG